MKKHTAKDNGVNWYSTIKKPSWAPPAWVFWPVWTVLYILIAISFGKVLLLAGGHEISFIIVLPFILNLMFNFTFTPLQFGLKNNILSAIDIVLIRWTILWSMIAIYVYLPRITYMQIPYLIWVSIATVLQMNITIMNRKHK